jgi:aryl-alcohol dehydrogenase-like predicted oxidoreductase
MWWIQAAGLHVSVIGLGGWELGTPAWGWCRDFGPAEARSIGARAAKRVRAAARVSLKRLGTGWIGLCHLHGLDRWIPEAVMMARMRDLLRSGEIRHVGVRAAARWRDRS